MRDDRDNSFWEDVLKWFLIWSFLIWLLRGFISLCKFFGRVIEQLISLAILGIKKAYPIVKMKLEQFKEDFNKIYKPQIDYRISQVEDFFANICSTIRGNINNCIVKSKECFESIIRIKNVRKQNKLLKKTKKNYLVDKSNLTLNLKKTKYYIVDFYYQYELKIFFALLIVIMMVVLAISIILLV